MTQPYKEDELFKTISELVMIYSRIAAYEIGSLGYSCITSNPWFDLSHVIQGANKSLRESILTLCRAHQHLKDQL